MSSWIADRIRSATFRAAFGLALSSLAGCAHNENVSARSPVDEESQGSLASGSASLEAYPPASPEDVAIGVDTSHYEDTDPSAVTEFRPALEGYGTWEDTPTYGTVWVPSTAAVGSDFVPYSTGGHWTYDDSWVWVSDYEWGWAPFHYGRWVHVPGRGWAWIPGRTYSGAWVTWAYGPTYVGWAPLGPSWYWYNGYPVGVHVWSSPYYVYCPHHAVFAPGVAAHVIHGPAAAAIAVTTPPQGGGGYVPAQPSVGGPSRIPATPTVNPAPTPGQLGHPLASVPKPPTTGNLVKARALATPDQAERIGARAPASGAGFVAGGSSPRYAPPERDGFAASGGGVGSGSTGASVARLPRSAGSFVGRSDTSSSVSPSRGPDPWRLDPPQGERSRVAAPTRVDPRPSYGSAPAYTPRSTTSITTPSYAAPSRSAPPSPSPSPVYRAPSYSPSSTPVYRAPAASAPVYRAPSAPVYHAPAAAPVYRAPSAAPAPAYRPSAPAPAPAARPSTPAPASRSQSRSGRR